MSLYQLLETPAMLDLLAESFVRDFRRYLAGRSIHSGCPRPTVGDLAKTFRLTCAEVAAVLDHRPDLGLTVSSFAYTQPPSDGWGPVLLHAFQMQYAPDAPLSRRLVFDMEEPHDDPTATHPV